MTYTAAALRSLDDDRLQMRDLDARPAAQTQTAAAPAGANMYWIHSACGRRLTVPLRIDISVDPDDGAHIAFCAFVLCTGVGASAAAAVRELEQEMGLLRDQLDSAADDTLAPDARLIKQRLITALP